MSKSIYKEALEIVAAALDLPDRSVTFKHTVLNVIKEALQQAQKQEKLLELYKKWFIKTSNYIENYKKQEKLLKLYREALETNFEGITLIKLVNKTLRTQIKELEK